MMLKLFRKKKMQTFLICLIIVFCTALICGAFCIITSLDAPYEKYGKECQSPDARFFPIARDRTLAAQEVKKFEKLDMVKSVINLDVYSHVDSMEVNGKKIDSFSHVTTYQKELFQHARIGDGKKENLSNLGEDECFVPICVALENNIKVGDTLRISFSTTSKEYTVKGTYAEPYDLSSAFDTYLIIKEIPSSVQAETGIHCFITVKDGENPEDLTNAFRNANDGKMAGTIETLSDYTEEIQITNNILGAVFLAIGIIVLLSGCMIISFIIRNTMLADAKKTAIMKIIGYSSGKIIRMYLGFYFIVSFISAVIGVVASLFLSKFVLKSAFDAMGKEPEIVIFTPGIISVCGIVSFVLLIIGAVVLKTRKVKPVSILCDQSEVTTKKRRRSHQMKMLFSPAGIAMRNIIRNPKGTVGILLTSIITIFIINFGMISLNVANKVSQTNDFWFGVDKCDVSIELQDNNSNFPKVMDKLEKDTRVEKAIPVSFTQKIQTKWQNNKGGDFLGCFVYEDYSKVNVPLVEGKNPSNKDEIAITAKVADRMGLKIGDYLTLDFPDGTRASYLICGTFQTYWQMGDAARLRKDALTSHGQKVIMSNISIYLKPGVDRDKFVKEYRNIVDGGGSVRKREEVFQSVMNMIAAPQQRAIPAVVVIVLTVGGISIFSIVLLQASKNHRNSSIYKCIGYSTGHLVCSNLIHTLIISLLATCIAVPICIAMYPYIMKICLMTFGLKVYPIQYTLKYALIANGSVIIIFILATLLSSRRLRKVDVRELIQE